MTTSEVSATGDWKNDPDSAATFDETPRHAARLTVSYRLLRYVLGIPRDVEIVAALPDPVTGDLVLHLSGATLPEAPHRQTLPVARVYIHSHQNDNGEWWKTARFEVEKEGE